LAPDIEKRFCSSPSAPIVSNSTPISSGVRVASSSASFPITADWEVMSASDPSTPARGLARAIPIPSIIPVAQVFGPVPFLPQFPVSPSRSMIERSIKSPW
jgi:hypothetical protein